MKRDCDNTMNQTVKPVDVTVYRITGRQGLIDVPHRYCEECDLTVQVVQRTIDEAGTATARLTVRPWMLWFWRPIVRDGWHAPIVTVNGHVVSPGVVPAAETIRQSILTASRARGHERTDRLANSR